MRTFSVIFLLGLLLGLTSSLKIQRDILKGGTREDTKKESKLDKCFSVCEENKKSCDRQNNNCLYIDDKCREACYHDMSNY